MVESGGYTHLWIMQDTFHFGGLAKPLHDACKRKKIKTAFYFPVDAPMDTEWCDILHAVQHPVAYCEYGRNEAVTASVFQKRISLKQKLEVIPHGVDAEVYRPMPEERARRSEMFKDAKGKSLIAPNDFLIMNVSANQRRKGLVQTLEIYKALKLLIAAWGTTTETHLYMHMRRTNNDEQCDLQDAARQLGIKVLFAPDALWPKGVSEQGLASLYNCADLLLTTSLGEGWGLPITEAMACGTPVAGPDHTSIAEIMGGSRGVLFGTAGLDWVPGDNSRLRPRSNVADAAQMISDAIQNDNLKTNAAFASEWVKGMGWDAIAQTWLDIIV